MSQSLSRVQALVLGLVVVLGLVAGGYGLFRVADKQGLWADTTELTVGFPEAHDITPGTVVRIRGVDAGQVVAVEYPDHDGPDAAVTVRMKVDAKFAGRLFADASAMAHSTGIVGSQVIAVHPGTAAAGPLTDGKLKAKEAPTLAQAAGKLNEVADEVKGLVRDARSGSGTLGKLLTDDKLYAEITGLAHDSRLMVKRADGAIGGVEAKVADVDRFVQDGRDTLRSVRQGTDAVQKMPLIRGYVTDAAALLVRPDLKRAALDYNMKGLFEPGTAILTADGQSHLTVAAGWVKESSTKSEVVVVARCAPTDATQTGASAAELTKKQAEVALEYIKASRAHRTSWFSSRKATALGLGFAPSPVVGDPADVSYLQVVLFSPP